MQVSVEPAARHQGLAAATNAWLAARPRVGIEEQTVQIFHNHSTNTDYVLVMLRYRAQASWRAKKRQ